MVSLDPAIVRRDKAVRITMLLYAPKKSEKSEKSEAPDIQEKAPQGMMFREDEADE
jgi:hypothetical protein